MKNVFTAVLVIIVFASCKKAAKTATEIKVATYNVNVLVLGNSITYSPANPTIGWSGNWGMAASAADSDYVHLLTARFQAANKASTLVAKNIADFENNFDTYDLDLNLKTYRDAKPDLIIFRIGENVTRVSDSVLFDKKYAALLNYFTAANPKVKILAAGSVWPDRDMPNAVMSKYSTYISLVNLQTNLSNFAFGLYPNAAIQSHPSNKGMKAITDQIWVAAQKLLQ
jgi:lysophospholipase L1-like esterase